MTKNSAGRSEHYIRYRNRFDHATGGYTIRVWEGISTWDIKDGGRLRREMQRSTTMHDEQTARRWARRYKVEFPVEPEARGHEK